MPLFEKGKVANPRGRPRGIKNPPSLKEALTRLLTPATAEAVVQTLIDMAVKDKDIKAIELIAKLKNELGPSATQVAVQINQISEDTLIERAKKYADTYAVDLAPLNISASLAPLVSKLTGVPPPTITTI